MLKTLIENDDLIFLFAIYGYISYLRDVGNCLIGLFKKKEIETKTESETQSETSEIESEISSIPSETSDDSDYDPIKEKCVFRKRKRTK